MKKLKPRSDCPLSYTLDFFGDKWSLLIIRDLILFDKSTYGEFLNSKEKIATNILADRLNMLETYGFVTKAVATDKKSKFVYSLTEKGIGLVPILVEISLWGSQYNPPGLAGPLLHAFQTDKPATIEALQARLRQRLHQASTSQTE
ncbi:winged helix-turn-helix transcriptional regulator [Salmonirosea aquatica]|uniref:Transcriptional regulator n=1 Tax=Salmonirosea aquatica TaxID=2654236 RepID=A0A7C9FG12_9BACT|nr:transcriptional regulator [Cytophagaceae bacterium SJW1-29]